MFSPLNTKPEATHKAPFISTSSLLYSSCSGIRNKLLSREFQYKVNSFEKSFKKNKMKNSKVHIQSSRNHITTLQGQDTTHWLNKRSRSKQSRFSDFSNPELVVAGNWFCQQMKIYFDGGKHEKLLVVNEFVKNGFFNSGVEGSRFLARMEPKNNGYLTQDDFIRFMHQIAKAQSFNDHQFNDIRDFVHIIGGNRLVKEIERANKFEKVTEKIQLLARASFSLPPDKIETSNCHVPEHSETVVSPAKGGGIMYFAKPRHKHKLLQFLSDTKMNSSEESHGFYSTGSCGVRNQGHLKHEKRKGSIDVLDDDAIFESNLMLQSEEDVRIEASTRLQEAIIDTAVELMDDKKKLDTCAMVIESLTTEQCSKNIQSSAAKRFVYNAEKIIMQNKSAPKMKTKSTKKVYIRA
jgi:hypothetical protein